MITLAYEVWQQKKKEKETNKVKLLNQITYIRGLKKYHVKRSVKRKIYNHFIARLWIYLHKIRIMMFQQFQISSTTRDGIMIWTMLTDTEFYRFENLIS